MSSSELILIVIGWVHVSWFRGLGRFRLVGSCGFFLVVSCVMMCHDYIFQRHKTRGASLELYFALGFGCWLLAAMLLMLPLRAANLSIKSSTL